MKVLITNMTLAARTGTEIVARDLAIGLTRAGHEACVFSPLPGAVAQEIIAAGAPVVSRLEDVPFEPDIIHGHHHVESTLAVLHFGKAPAIFVCHDRRSWHDTPPRLNAIRRYVAVDRNCLERLTVEAGIPSERTRLILNAVDLRRLLPHKPLPARPVRALVFSNYAIEGERLETLRQFCRESEMELSIAGSGVGAQAVQPEAILGEYDLVFAKARCALEALAAGCAVILCDWQGLGPMVTSAQLPELREWNLGARCLQQRLSLDALRQQAARYDPVEAACASEYVRGNASLDDAVARYVEVYEEAITDGRGVSVSVGDAVESLARKVGSLESRLRVASEPNAMGPLPRHVGADIAIRISNIARRVAAGAALEASVEIDNRSAEALASVPPYPVSLAYHWLDRRSRQYVEFDGVRTNLSAAVRPHSRHWQKMSIAAPGAPGRYVLALTLVQEHNFWFDQLAEPVSAEWEITVDGGEDRPVDERTLAEVVSWTSAQIVRDGEFHNLAFVSHPTARMLTFAEAPPFVAAAIESPDTACVLTRPDWISAFPERIAVAVAADPRRCFFEIHNRLAMESDFYGRDFPSMIHKTARLHPRCWVDEKNVIVGAGVEIGPNASVLGRAVLGDGAVIQAGAVVGAAGFQTSHRRGNPIEMVHAGTTEIGAGSHIFANAVIARGLFRQSTFLGSGCRVGNSAFVSHNCVLGDEVFVGHGAVVNGNVRIGAYAWIGPGATVVNEIEIGEAAQVSLGATVVRNVDAGKRVTGSLAMEHRKMLRMMAAGGNGKER